MPHDQYEIIVVDDCSTDNSADVLDTFEKIKNVKVIYLSENKGVSNASNIGIREALAPYIMRVDADDYINQNMLHIFSEILNWNPDICFVYGDIYKVDENGNHLERIRLNILENLFNHGAGIMFRKSCLEAVGLYDMNIRNCEDFDLLKRIFRNFDGYYLKLPFYRYRMHENNMTNDSKERERWRKIVLSKYEDGGEVS
jgi:glycosyltransferase involved in cell wall biosynthesis